MRVPADLTGRTVGLLVVIRPADKKRFWECRCDCGASAIVRTDHLVHSRVKSCGCFRRSVHGMHHSTTHKTWDGMIQRCTNPNNTSFERYGARGVAVSPRWMKFSNFLADMGERPVGRALDRIDNAKGYEPGNCRWATHAEQGQNRRSNRLSPDIVREIMARSVSGEGTYAIAAALNIGASSVSMVLSGRIWKNVA